MGTTDGNSTKGQSWFTQVSLDIWGMKMFFYEYYIPKEISVIE